MDHLKTDWNPQYMSDLTAIEERLGAYVRGELVPAGTELEPETDLVGLVDSAAIVELIVWIETEYGFDVELESYSRLARECMR